MKNLVFNFEAIMPKIKNFIKYKILSNNIQKILISINNPRLVKILQYNYQSIMPTYKYSVEISCFSCYLFLDYLKINLVTSISGLYKNNLIIITTNELKTNVFRSLINNFVYLICFYRGEGFKTHLKIYRGSAFYIFP